MNLTKFIAAIAISLIAAFPCISGDGDDAVKTLAKLELDWANAVERNDVDAIARFLHPDFTFTSPRGGIADRASHLDDFRNGNSRFTLVALSEVEVRVYGQRAVVTSRPTIDGMVKANGSVITMKCQRARWTDSLIFQDGAWTCVARHQSNIPPPATSATPVLEQILKEKVDGKETKLSVIELEYAPGAGTPPHHHPGPVVVYVLDGAIESQVEGKPLATYRRGDAFFEPAGGKHLVSRNASQIMPARFLAYFLAPKGEPLTTFDPPGRHASAPEYDVNGHLKLPADFRTWIFVGSNIGLRYRKDVAETTPRERARHVGQRIGDFHNIYMNPDAYEHYVKTGKFPEKTVLVMDVYMAKDKEPQNVVTGGYFPGDHREIEVAVKNSNRPDGCKTEWAYYIFPDEKPVPAQAEKDADCYSCHRKHAAKDNVWVQFYPTLRGNIAPSH